MQENKWIKNELLDLRKGNNKNTIDSYNNMPLNKSSHVESMLVSDHKEEFYTPDRS